MNLRSLTVTAILSAVILISGAFKIPSPAAGSEFQLSAPASVLICACFGFKRYITAGIAASLLGLLLGTANIFSIITATVFRITAGAVLAAGGANLPAVIISGPLGTLAARFVLSQILDVNWLVLAAAAAPGIIFTAAVSGALYAPARRLLGRIPLAGGHIICRSKTFKEQENEFIQH